MNSLSLSLMVAHLEDLTAAGFTETQQTDIAITIMCQCVVVTLFSSARWARERNTYAENPMLPIAIFANAFTLSVCMRFKLNPANVTKGILRRSPSLVTERGTLNIPLIVPHSWPETCGVFIPAYMRSEIISFRIYTGGPRATFIFQYIPVAPPKEYYIYSYKLQNHPSTLSRGNSTRNC